MHFIVVVFLQNKHFRKIRDQVKSYQQNATSRQIGKHALPVIQMFVFRSYPSFISILYGSDESSGNAAQNNVLAHLSLDWWPM